MTSLHAAAVIAAELERSDERDLWQRVSLDRERAAYLRGWEDGIAEGRHLEAAELAAAWTAAARPVTRSEPFAELERRRWGPGGRAHFASHRAGDFPGRGAA